jgi:hypothetical protein
VLGPEHPNTLTSVNNRAALLETKGEYAAAEHLYRRALESARKVLGPDHPRAKLFERNLALFLAARDGQAEPPTPPTS